MTGKRKPIDLNALRSLAVPHQNPVDAAVASQPDPVTVATEAPIVTQADPASSAETAASSPVPDPVPETIEERPRPRPKTATKKPAAAPIISEVPVRGAIAVQLLMTPAEHMAFKLWTVKNRQKMINAVRQAVVGDFFEKHGIEVEE